MISCSIIRQSGCKNSKPTHLLSLDWVRHWEREGEREREREGKREGEREGGRERESGYSGIFTICT